MKTEYKTRLKPEVTQRFYRDLATGNLKINTPFGNLNDMPFEITDVEESRLAYNPFANYIESKQAYNYAMSALDGFRQHLKVNNVLKIFTNIGVNRPRISHRYVTSSSS